MTDGKHRTGPPASWAVPGESLTPAWQTVSPPCAHCGGAVTYDQIDPYRPWRLVAPCEHPRRCPSRRRPLWRTQGSHDPYPSGRSETVKMLAFAGLVGAALWGVIIAAIVSLLKV